MPSSGKLNLRIIWDGRVVRDVEVKSTRPQAYRLLKGKLATDAVKMVPLLYSVCGKAQYAAAIAATTVARGIEQLTNGALERQICCEAMQEHLWRLLLDWPKLLGLQQQQNQFVEWYSALKEIASGTGNAEILHNDLCQVLLGMTVAEWKQIDSYSKLVDWQIRGQGVLAPLFAALNLEEKNYEFSGQFEQSELMPNWSASELVQLFNNKFDDQLATRPQMEGKTMETGVLSQGQQSSLLRDVLSNCPVRVLARLIARLVDLQDSAESLLQENFSGLVQSISVSNTSGLSKVRTARGMLLHYVRIESDRIADYLTVAPTEWNFHPQGTLVKGLIGLKVDDAERLMRKVKIFVLSLDPCVEYDIEISHA